MANTYFEMKVIEKESLPGTSLKVALTAFVGHEKTIQVTLSPAPHYGNCYVPLLLTDKEAIRLAKALLERAEGKITATGSEVSEFTDIEEEEEN